MPAPFPSSINEKKLTRTFFFIVALTIISWPLYLALFFDTPYSYIPFFIVLLTMGSAYYAKRWIFLLFLLLNPLVIMLLFYIILPTARYMKGEPTIISCGYDIYEFDKNEMVYLHYYDDDCELGDMFYACSDDLNNTITHFWVNVFGNPVDVVPDNLDPEEIYEAGDL
jgi:hypothetical protein